MYTVLTTVVRQINTNIQARQNVQKAFEFTLDHIGQDKDAGDIWVSWIRFIQESEVCTILVSADNPIPFTRPPNPPNAD